MSAIHFHSHIYEFSCKIKIHRKLRRSFFSWLYIYLLHWGEYVFYKSILFFLNKINYCYDSLSSLIKNETTDFRTTSILNLHCILVFQYFHTRGIYWIFSINLIWHGKIFFISTCFWNWTFYILVKADINRHFLTPCPVQGQVAEVCKNIPLARH